MIDVRSQGVPFLMGACRIRSYECALDFARYVPVPFRLVVSQRLLVPEDAPRSVADLLAGRPVRFPRIWRDVLVFGLSGYVAALADCVRRFDLVGGVPQSRPYHCLQPFHVARVRPVVGARPPLSASFFSSERSYDLVLDLFPAGGAAFAWRAGCFIAPGPDLPDNVPVWVSCSDGALASEDIAAVCGAAWVSCQ